VRPDTLADRRRVYLLARLLVSRHYRRPLTLVGLARALSTSPRQLQRAYAQFDDSFHEDLLRRRMTVAAQLLIEQRSIPVADVARLVGYHQAPAFAHAFRLRYGLTPSLFRERAARHALTAGQQGRAGPVPPAQPASPDRGLGAGLRRERVGQAPPAAPRPRPRGRAARPPAA
jgi:AraC-like DNA-binding protein